MSDFFFSLTPEHILDAVEKTGLRSTGRCFALNSLENRVYEVEMEEGAPLIGKFYRPQRWTRESILEEHEFLADLAAAEIPVVEPLKINGDSTLNTTPEGILFSVFPKVRGRAPQELQTYQLEQLGRLIARIHNVGATKKTKHRLILTPETYATKPLQFLLDGNFLPLELINQYTQLVQELVSLMTPWFDTSDYQRIHGDCHLGNLLYNQEKPFFLDFDDMVFGPPVQDLWLLVGGNDEEALQARQIMIRGYQEMRKLDLETLKLVEPLRALRIIHYCGWIAKRWKDPAFPRIFTEFGTHKYWLSEIENLQRQLRSIKGH